MADRTERDLLVDRQAECRVEVAETTRLEVENSADREAGIGLAESHRCQMPAGRPAAENELAGGNAETRPRPAQPAQSGAHLADDLGQLDLGCQRIADERDVEAARERPLG